MESRCFICDAVPLLNVEELFGNSTKFESGRKLDEIVSEIIGKPAKENGHSQMICRDCHKSCVDYDVCQKRMSTIKSYLTNQFKQTLPKHNLSYDNYPMPLLVSGKKLPVKILPNNISPVKYVPSKVMPGNVVPINIKRPIVLPASKMRTIKPPPVVVLKKMPNQKFNLTVTLGSTVLTQSIVSTVSTPATYTKTTPSTSLVEEIASLSDEKVQHYLDSSILSTSESILGYNSLPTNIFDNCKKSENDKDILAKSMEVINSGNENDETMDIDEECTYVLKNETNVESEELIASMDELDQNTEIVDENDNSDETNQPIVFGDLEIMEEVAEDGTEGHTILVEGEDGSLVRVTSGQRFVLGDREISLIIPDGGEDNADSNDESQIELQMSGDEETANAIIAATQKEGGAYIAVQSGEFFQVGSVKSKIKRESNNFNGFVEQNEDGYVCMLCANKNSNELSTLGAPFTSASADKIMQHMKTVHGARVYVCAVCGAVLRRKLDYSRHIAEHDPKSASTLTVMKKYDCEICKKKFVSRNMLKEHLNTHSGERPYTCNVCNKGFASKYTFQAHQKIHLDRPRPFRCEICTKTFYTQQNLNQHEKTHTGARDFICKICDKAFLTQHNLEVHALVHSGVKSFVCGLCGKAFARKPEIRDHMRTHTGERPFSCSICPAAFAQRSNLQSHVRATHRGEKRHACDQCGQRFKRRRLLQYHVRARHTGERPHACAQCGASFVYPEHCKKHARIHSGSKPYDCEVCGRQFNSRDSRNAHRFVHSDKKPYECVVCGAGFMRRPRLYQHMNAAGHLAESIVVNQPKISKDGDKETIELLTESSLREASTPTTFLEEAAEQQEDDPLCVFDDQDEDARAGGAQLSDELVEISKANIGEFELAEAPAGGDEPGALVRLVQVTLPRGGRGWVAVS